MDIDCDVCRMLIDAAPVKESLTFSKTLPVGVSLQEHYASFTAKVYQAKKEIFDVTKKYEPTWLLVNSGVLPVLAFCPNFTPANSRNAVGPHYVGDIDGIKVYVTPELEEGKFVFGVNAPDFKVSAGVFGLYMPCVPTALLQFADGTTNQGFSSLYDCKILNDSLLVAGAVVA